MRVGVGLQDGVEVGVEVRFQDLYRVGFRKLDMFGGLGHSRVLGWGRDWDQVLKQGTGIGV